MGLAYTLNVIILFIAVAAVYELSARASKSKKFKIWGIATMVVFGPLFSLFIGMIYAMFVQNGWAVLDAMAFLVPIIFVIGAGILFVGFFQRKAVSY